jgi:hypothetical protein
MSARFNGGLVRFGLPGVVLGAMLSWFWGAREPLALAQATGGVATGVSRPLPGRPGDAGRPLPQRPVARGEANGTLALVTSPTGAGQWLYLIDTTTQAFAVYRVDPTNPKGTVKLEAARQYQWDLKLEHYNNQAPEPTAIEAMVKALEPTRR